jgi:hypothetical protein
VYGNAIANGQIVATSYTGSINQDYLGNSITSPYIYEDTNGASTPTKYEIGDAVLVWQDVPNLITNVRLDTDKKNLLFTIDSNTIRQGNAVVAVRDNNSTPRIMWSWHIWVTAHNLMNVKTFTNSDNRTYNLMPVFLGWTSKGGTMSQYAGRELVVRIQQDNGKTATFSIKQQGGMNFEGKSQGEALFYQWGRKEPLPSLSRYYESPNGYTFSAISGNSRSAFIQNPSKLINNQTFNTTNVQKAWCVNGTTNPTSATLRVTKTIYDPCPAGFHVAETGVLKDIGSNQVCGSFNKGWEYYTDDRKSTMYLPALGRMDYTSNSSSITMSLVGTYCNVWLSSLYSSTAGYIIYASSSAHDYFRYDGSPGYGRCIIAVQDY